MIDVAKLRSRIRKKIENVAVWQKRQLFDPSLDDCTSWLAKEVVESDVKLVPQYFQDISRYNATLYSMSELAGSFDIDCLSVSTRSGLAGFFLEVPIYDFHPENLGYYRIDEYGFLLAQVIATGWKDEAELVARHGFVELNRLMDRGITVRLMPWFMLELAKDWLGANVSLDTEFRSAEIRDLGIWQKLLDGWRSAEGAAFDALMSEMADYHLSQSADADGDGDWKEFEDMAYWLFPVELLAVLRLREWLGIPVVKLTHPLFNATSLGRLCPTPKWPQHDVLDAVEKKFQSIYPNTPSLSDLPRLRQEQG